MLIACAAKLLLPVAPALHNVPSPPPTSTALSHLPRGIILVEEYSALAVAIVSALRKFAPLHIVKVAHDFVEAERLASSIQPELFVCDIDPPLIGDLEFFGKIRTQYPDGRALVLAATISPELLSERGTAGAIQFIEKPFDLAEFGAAIQALVGPWNGIEGSPRGTLRDLNLIDLVQLRCLTLSSCVLRIESAGGHGALHLFKGEITHAVTETKVGRAALEEMAAWWPIDWSENELPSLAPRTIEVHWAELLLPVIRQVAQRQRRAAATVQPARHGKKVLIIDDTEMLRIFVADVLATANHTFRLLSASSGEEGVRLASSEQPDLILLDYSLGDMTGDCVCQKLLENDATVRIPVLMMSGHLTELTRTAGAYPNVVAALPKPFLSGALINEVEKALAAGPLTAPAATKPGLSPPPPVATPVSPPPTEAPAPSPNGHGPTADGFAAKLDPAPTETGTLVQAPVADPTPVTTPFVRQPALHLTFTLDVAALELTPWLQTASARLEPISRFVAVEMIKGIPLETGFCIGRIELARDGSIGLIRLVPTQEPIPLSAVVNSFAIGNVRFEAAKHHLELKAAPERSMRVQLKAPFVLTGIDLSPNFEVAAIVLQARGREVILRNRDDDPGRSFELLEVELDAAGELRMLFVRPVSVK